MSSRQSLWTQWSHLPGVSSAPGMPQGCPVVAHGTPWVPHGPSIASPQTTHPSSRSLGASGLPPSLPSVLPERAATAAAGGGRSCGVASPASLELEKIGQPHDIAAVEASDSSSGGGSGGGASAGPGLGGRAGDAAPPGSSAVSSAAAVPWVPVAGPGGCPVPLLIRQASCASYWGGSGGSSSRGPRVTGGASSHRLVIPSRRHPGHSGSASGAKSPWRQPQCTQWSHSSVGHGSPLMAPASGGSM